LAIQHHPDKNPGNEEAASAKFKEVAAAYETLSNPDKRSNYDRFGHADIGPGGFGHGGMNMDHIDPFEIFQAFFGGVNPEMFAGPMGGGVLFANFGAPGGGVRFRMGGQGGQRHHFQQAHHRNVNVLKVSLNELYKGGKRRINNDEVDIPKGAKDGDRITSTIGNTVYVIEEIPHSNFSREGLNLSYTAILPFMTWLLTGANSFPINHLDGSIVKVDIRPFIDVWFQPSAVVKGRGMPSASRSGDLFVYSSCLSSEQRSQLMAFARGIGTIILVFLVMTNPSLLFLVLLLKPLFS
jgi:DnaJ-class molecular chaperone